jgi:hypothetical protein
MTELSPQVPYKKEVERLEKLLKSDPNKEDEILRPQHRVVVVGATYFPDFDGKKPNLSDNVRGLQALETIKKLNKEGIDVCLVDGGSSEIFAEGVRGINPRLFFNTQTNRKAATLTEFVDVLEVAEESREKAEVFPGTIWFLEQRREGYSQARVEAIKAVTDVVTGFVDHEVIIQMEIEKTQITEGFEKMVRLITEDKADIVIPDRGIRVRELGDEYDNFCNYPKFQAVSERKANLLIHQMLVEAGLRGREDPVLDFFGGTRVIKDAPDLRRLFGVTFEIPEDSPFWGEVKPEAYSNAVYFPIYIALALNKRVDSVPIDYSYPAKQSKLEAKDKSFAAKRVKQFDDIVNGSKLLIRFLGSKLKTVRLTGKVIDKDTIIKVLRESAVVDLKDMEWTDKNEFDEERHYRKVGILPILDGIVNKKLIIKYLDDAIASYVSNFEPDTAFLNWDEFKQVQKRVSLLKKGVKLFRRTKEAKVIYQKYWNAVLKNLTDATLMFYVLRDSDASRNLDIASFLAQAVEVPKTDYIKAVLLGTDDGSLLKELDGLAEHFHISPEERRKIISDFAKEVLLKIPSKKRAKVLNDIAKVFKVSPQDLTKQ